MSARVHVRAVIWVDDQVVVHKVTQRGELRVSLPGGRVNQRESIVDALRREVLEELGIEVNIGDLMFAAEVFSAARLQDVELVFAAEPTTEIFRTPVELVDPDNPDFVVLPPVLKHVAAWRRGDLKSRWVGNVYASPSALVSPSADA